MQKDKGKMRWVDRKRHREKMGGEKVEGQGREGERAVETEQGPRGKGQTDTETETQRDIEMQTHRATETQPPNGRAEKASV